MNPEEILRHARTIAVVGCSRTPGKPAHDVPEELLSHFDIIPVNPHADQIFGRTCYPTLLDVPRPVDLVNVFRPSQDAPEVARRAAAVEAKALWLQLGIRSDEARRIAQEAGMAYVEDACIRVVFNRMRR